MVGKRVASRTYAHEALFSELSEVQQSQLAAAISISQLAPGHEFNVARFDPQHEEVALLSYPDFFEESFPSLAASRRVHIPSGMVTFRDYSRSLNRPILHRKELLLPKSHPQQTALAELTTLAESLGLFDDPVRIGFQRQWQELLTSRGYQAIDGTIRPLGNVEQESPSDAPSTNPHQIERHLTALSRRFLSAPVQALLRHGLINDSAAFFDYGCGKGDDIAGLLSLGLAATGWDPHFNPDAPRSSAAAVNLGFVINVIDDIEERIAAVESAYDLTQGVLAVSAMLWSSTSPRGRPYADGFITSRNTFQRYYSQDELQRFIEVVLDEQAVPVGPGIFFVFRDRYLEQRFFSGRQVDVSRAPRLLAIRQRRASSLGGVSTRGRAEDPRKLGAINAIWQRALELGRIPEPDECQASDEWSELFGSWGRARAAALRHGDSSELEQAAQARADEVRLVFALESFGRRRRLVDLEPSLQRDVKTFFGSLGVAYAEGRRLLFETSDTERIRQACQKAADQGLGWLQPEHSLQLHSSLINRLDPILRAYLGCATALYGEATSADLLKIHIRSGKVSLMRFDDFDGSPIPRMIERVKVRLREQELDVFEYRDAFTPPPLYFKSRFINEEYPGYAEQVAFDTTLQELDVIDTEGYGPDYGILEQRLKLARYQISGMALVRSTDVPPIDQPCGKNFTYRDFVECGETWQATRVANVPTSPDTYNALAELARYVLDPVIDYFGAIQLTYGFSSRALAKNIKARIATKLDQHVSCESQRNSAPICSRLGAAVDFLVEDEDMREVANWIAKNTPFDRLYFYGADRPLHVSYGPESSGEIYAMRVSGQHRVPRRVDSL